MMNAGMTTRKGTELLVASYNIQHGIYFPARLESGDRTVRLSNVSELLAKTAPDLCGINEIYGEGSAFGDQPRQIAQALGYHYCFAKAIETANGPYGNALLSHFPIVEAHAHAIETDPDTIKPPRLYHENRVLLETLVDVDGVPLTVLVCHFGLNVEEAAEAVRVIEAVLARVQTPVLLTGDFNTTPDSAAISRLRTRLSDLFAGREALTFSSNSPEKQIDYIFASRDIKPLCAYAVPMVISDHLPVFARVAL